MKNFPAALLRNFGCGIRAALLWRTPLDRITAGWPHIAAALLLNLLPWFVSQWADVGGAGEPSAAGLPGIWYPFAIATIAVAIATPLLHLQARATQLLLALLNANIVIDTVVCAQSYLLPTDSAGADSDLSGYWLGLVIALQLLRARGMRDGRAWFVAVATGLAVCAAINQVLQTTTLWQEPYSEDQTQSDADDYAVVSEEVLYLQPALLAEHLDRLQSGPNGRTNLYFLGIAGDASQKVFLREIGSVEQLMREKFTADERSLLLINNRETLRTDPIATVTSIRETVNRMAEVMDRDNDILFVYLTSHGSHEDGFALSFTPLQLHDLQPSELRSILDDAGIRWRVIVVSACYSGTFIEPLADDRTLVITAAAADKTSFGCADENDFTYFGKAYFDEALRGTNSFIDAFDQAKVSVSEWERAEHQTASDPQISIGAEIRKKLDAFQAGLARRRDNGK